MTEDSPDEKELLAFAEQIAREAGALLLDRFAPVGGARAIEKKGVRELVTATDRASERLIVERIRQRFPDHSIYAEEGTAREQDDTHGLWIVDPLDGTTNWAHGLPPWAVSIACRRRGETLAAVVHAPYLDETFLAARGQGARMLRGDASYPLAVTDTAEMIEAVVATGFAYDINETKNDNVESWSRIVRTTRAARRCGAASLDIAWVAAGRFDGFWELYLAPYDVAAGAFVVQEAGGRVTDIAGGDDWLFGKTIVATNGPLHEPLRASLAAPIDDGTLPPSAFGG